MKFVLPIVAATILNNIQRTPQNKLSIKGILEVKHIIENRIRVLIPMLKNNDTAIKDLIAELSKIEIISAVEASPITGTLVIKFDQSKIEPVLLLGAIVKILGLEKQISKDENAALESEFALMTKSIDSSVMKVSNDKLDIKSTVTVIIIAGLAYNIFVNKAPLTTLPSPITLLWWMYQNNLMEKKEQ